MHMTENRRIINTKEDRVREFVNSLGIEDYLDLTHARSRLLQKLDEHLTGFHFLNEKHKPIELVEFYTITVNGKEERLARIYCSSVTIPGKRSYVPTIVIGSSQAVSYSTRKDVVSVERFNGSIPVANRKVHLEQLACIPGMKRILETDDLSFTVRPSSLRLSEIYQLQKHIQLRIFRDMTDLESGNYVALINHTDPTIPIFEGNCCIMLKSVKPIDKTRREAN